MHKVVWMFPPIFPAGAYSRNTLLIAEISYSIWLDGYIICRKQKLIQSRRSLHTNFPVGARRGELLRDDLRDVVGPARRAGVDVGEGARHAVRGEAGVVADRPRVRVVAATALEMKAGRGKERDGSIRRIRSPSSFLP